MALLTLRTLATADDQPAATPDSDTSSVALPDGFEKIVLEAGNAQKLSVGHKIKRANILIPEVADVVPLGPGDLLITAKKAGTTQLIIWDASDQTQIINIVVASDIEKLRKELKTTFPDATITVDETAGTLTLRGQVPTLLEATEATQIASNYGKVLNLLEIAGGEQIMLKVKIAEVSKQAEAQLGFNFGGNDGTSIWGSNIGANTLGITPGGTTAPNLLTIPSGAISTAQAFGTGLYGEEVFAYFINALETNNIIRLLAEPNLVTTSGQEAHFLAGGQFPYPVPQSGSGGGGTTITIEFQQYGVDLKFVPIVLGNGRIRLKVEPNVSELDYSHSVSVAGTSVPGLTQREVETTVEMAEGQTMALAGLLQDNISGNNAQMPLLGDLPIIGPLFRSVQYQRNETELVILVTPVLVHAINPADVTAAPGEHWRNPTNAELYLFKDLGGEDLSSNPAGPTSSRAIRPANQEISNTATAYAAPIQPAAPARVAPAASAAPAAPTASAAPAAPAAATPSSVNVTEPNSDKPEPAPAAPANPPPLFQGTYGFSPANNNSQTTAGASDSLK
ncbi:MAG: type II and III secretion system protein family protein [Tepidisphaeraceae bacterium]